MSWSDYQWSAVTAPLVVGQSWPVLSSPPHPPNRYSACANGAARAVACHLCQFTVSSRSSKSKSCTWVSRSSCTRQQCRGAHRQAHGLATRRSSFVHDEGHRRACCSPSPQWGAGSSRWRESRRAPSSPQDASQPSEEARSQVLQVTGRTRRSRSAETHCSRYERFSRAGSPRQEVAEFLNAFLVRRLMQVQFLGDSSLVCPYHSLLIPGVRQRIVHGLLTTKSPL